MSQCQGVRSVAFSLGGSMMCLNANARGVAFSLGGSMLVSTRLAQVFKELRFL